MDAAEALLSRASPLELGDPAPPREVLELAFRAAVRAPDHARLRPWRFVVIQGEERARFGDLLAEALRRRDPQAPEALVEKERSKALRAPVIIAVAAAIRDHKGVPEVEQILSAGAATQNIILALHAAGFGAVWKTGQMAYDSTVKTALGLAPTDHIVAIVYAGSVVRGPGDREPPDFQSFVHEWSAQGTAANRVPYGPRA